MREWTRDYETSKEKSLEYQKEDNNTMHESYNQTDKDSYWEEGDHQQHLEGGGDLSCAIRNHARVPGPRS